MPDKCSPKLSIVVTSRNDNHGGDLLKRMQIFIDGIIHQSTKFELLTELILVEWNPPENKLMLVQALQWPVAHPFCDIRIIEVPKQLHDRYRFPDKLPLHQMIGKNVGVYRARGDFILATNIDIVFSDDLFRFLASENLSKGFIYRTDRFDVSREIALDDTHEEKLLFCENHIIRDFSYSTEHQFLAENMKGHDITKEPPHINACGDFQLMDKKNWHNLRGYPEFDIYPLHVDGLFQFNVILHGIKEIRLEDKLRAYHIDHEGSWVPGAGQRIQNSYQKSSIPIMSQVDPLSFIHLMKSDIKNSNIFNDNTWGLNEYSLREIRKVSEGTFSNYSIAKNQSISSKLTSETDYWLSKCEELKIETVTFGKKTFSDWVNNFITVRGSENVNYDNRKIVVFGAGSCYDIFIKPVLNMFNIKPAYIVDNYKYNTSIDGLNVKSILELKKESKGDLLVIVASSYYTEIKEQLESHHFSENVNFIRGYYMPLFWDRRNLYHEVRSE